MQLTCEQSTSYTRNITVHYIWPHTHMNHCISKSMSRNYVPTRVQALCEVANILWIFSLDPREMCSPHRHSCRWDLNWWSMTPTQLLNLLTQLNLQYTTQLNPLTFSLLTPPTKELNCDIKFSLSLWTRGPHKQSITYRMYSAVVLTGSQLGEGWNNVTSNRTSSTDVILPL